MGLSLFDMRDAGRGYGRRMLTRVSDYLRDFFGLHKVSLKVLASNERAVALYRRLGFSSRFFSDALK